MGPEITVTIKIATTAETDVVSAIKTAGEEYHIPEVPSEEALTGMVEGDISEPPTHGQLDEPVEGAELPPPMVEAAVGVDEGDVPEVPALDEIDEVVEDAVPVPDIDRDLRYEDLEDLADADVPPLPDVGFEATFEEQQESADADIPPIPSV